MRSQLVETVDEHGATTGSCLVDDAHRTPGTWHRAFSVVVVEPGGRALFQRRAGVKARFGGIWANTCCGHVGPGVPLLEQARTRVEEELGLRLTELTEVGVFRYEAPDRSDGTPGTTGARPQIERELDHVLLARVGPAEAVRLRPDPAEVAETLWAPLADEGSWPQPLAPWVAAVLRLVTAAPAPVE